MTVPCSAKVGGEKAVIAGILKEILKLQGKCTGRDEGLADT